MCPATVESKYTVCLSANNTGCSHTVTIANCNCNKLTACSGAYLAVTCCTFGDDVVAGILIKT